MDSVKLWGIATVGTKGQIVIPVDARASLELREGDKVVILSPLDKPSLMLVKAEIFETMLNQLQTSLMTMDVKSTNKQKAD